MNPVPTLSRRASTWAQFVAAATLLIGGFSFAATPVTKEANANDVPTALTPAAVPGKWSHAYVAYGQPPKYPRGYTHFDFVNPDAPKGGTVYLGNPDRRTSFDKFNPYTLKGNEPTGVLILMFEPLAVRSGDTKA
jgi:ABC-type oligopeptide transport system substrate-binding subunit